MYATKNEDALTREELHVFRMIGTRADVGSSCKATLAAAGFTQFTSYGNSFVCVRQMDVSGGRLMLFVQIEVLGLELCEVSFEKVESSMKTVHQQMIYNKLGRIQDALEIKAA